jgi:hypothetical protein
MPDLIQYCTLKFENALHHVLQTGKNSTVLELIKEWYENQGDSGNCRSTVLMNRAMLLAFERGLDSFVRSGEHAKAVAWMDEIPAATADLFKQKSEMQQSGICGKSFMQALSEVSEALLANSAAP